MLNFIPEQENTMPMLSRRRIYVATLSFAVSIVALTSSFAAEIRVFSGGAPKEVLTALTPEFEKQTGHKVQFTFAVVGTIQQKLAAGEKPDMVLLPVPALDNLIRAGTLRAEPRPVLGSVGIGVIVPQDAARPDISSTDKLRKVLLDAKSVVHANPAATPSGAHMGKVLDQLGIADAMKQKVVHRNAIDGGAEMVGKGEAEIGLFPLSEVITVKGIALAGMLPAEQQMLIVYGAAALKDNPSPEPTQAFIKFLSDPANRKHWKDAGFDTAAGGGVIGQP
jgi:molybdate transport system substrate-binding protein